MNSVYKLVCRLLIATLIVLPFSANAGMIGTPDAAASASDLSSRDQARDVTIRQGVASELEAMGLSSTAVQERVAALTQEEVNRIAGQTDTAPAGALSHGWWLAIIAVIVAGVVYSVWGPGFNRTSR